MTTTNFLLRAVFACMNSLLFVACAAGVPSQPAATNSPPEALSTQLEPGMVPTVVTNPVLPTPYFPPDWVQFTSESARFSFYHAPGWVVTAGDFHVEVQSPTGYAWVEVDLLSPENPGLAGEPLASGGDLTQLSAQLESALRENGSFGEPELLTRPVSGSEWVIEGNHESFGDNVVIALVSSGTTTYQFIGHQGDLLEDWDSLKMTYRQMIGSMSFK